MEKNYLYIVLLILVIIAVFVAIFIILRGFILWYYKIDTRIQLLEENNELLKKLLDK